MGTTTDHEGTEHTPTTTTLGSLRAGDRFTATDPYGQRLRGEVDLEATGLDPLVEVWIDGFGDTTSAWPRDTEVRHVPDEAGDMSTSDGLGA